MKESGFLLWHQSTSSLAHACRFLGSNNGRRDIWYLHYRWMGGPRKIGFLRPPCVSVNLHEILLKSICFFSLRMSPYLLLLEEDRLVVNKCRSTLRRCLPVCCFDPGHKYSDTLLLVLAGSTRQCGCILRISLQLCNGSETVAISAIFQPHNHVP